MTKIADKWVVFNGMPISTQRSLRDEHFDAVPEIYHARHTEACMILYEVTSRASFELAQR